ncbi:type II secretion system protein [Vibrio japonicus]|uniref:Type II secretion system GspH family protein n=1 Tax=Vibrio japonicus TaxID=1824638 RepID=A0ABY5LII8_9VIBR|nr:type II secretion system protein [Vibrio japonicus]UUM30912.1 type II secretion system GspH family protein [Vibrio japonicus]
MDIKPARGFTLVELIVVILLLAIVSVYAASRMFGRDSVAAMVVRQQVISVIRQVQVNRMQSNVDLSNVTGDSSFVLAVNSDCIGSQQACALKADTRSDWVDSDGNGVFFSVNTSPIINFDLLGNPLDSSASGAVITISSSQDKCEVKINAQGYVFSGDCS